jgi:hypothetical protein
MCDLILTDSSAVRNRRGSTVSLFFSSFMFPGRVIISHNFDSKSLQFIFLKLCLNKLY